MKTMWLKKVSIALIIPFVVLVLLECSLRLLNVGVAPDAFVPTTLDGKPAWTGNPFFSYRFFSPPLARIPAPILVEQEKPDDTLRVVILGESAAQGDPFPAFGMPRMLNVMLSERYPNKNIEVINAAITAITTPVIVEIASELPKLKPDVVIVYAGNNDVIGPFGPVTALFKIARTDWMQRLAVALTRLRLFQLIGYGQAIAAELNGPVQFVGVSRMLHRPLTHDTPQLVRMRSQYKINMRRIVENAHRAGAEVIVCTVAVNVGDCPPAISENSNDLTGADKQTWETLYEKGLSAFSQQAWEQALEEFETARSLDDQHAELIYRLAVCQERLGRIEEARINFTRAMDLDAFRCRTDSLMNNAVRSLAGESGAPVHLVDADSVFRNQGVGRDRELFVDHVHFSPEGTYLLALTLANTVSGLPPFRELTSGTPGWPTLDDVKKASLFNPVAEQLLAQKLLSRYAQPPFTQHFDIADRIQRQTQISEEMNHRIRPLDIDSLQNMYRNHVIENPRDWEAQDLWGQYLLTVNRFQDVVQFIGPLVEQQPQRRSLRAIVAEALVSLNQPEDAADVLLGWNRKQGFLAAQTATGQLGALISNGQEDQAEAYAEALVSRMRWIDYRWRLRAAVNGLRSIQEPRDMAIEMIKRGDMKNADALLTKLITFRPDWPVPAYALAVSFGLQGSVERGVPLMQQSIQLWGPARTAYHAGLWEARFGQLDRAYELFAQSSEIAGDDQELVRSLVWMMVAYPRADTVRNSAAAHTLAGHLVDGFPPCPENMDVYAAVLAAGNSYDEAVEYAERAGALAAEQGNQALAKEIETRRDRYQKKQSTDWPRLDGPMSFF